MVVSYYERLRTLSQNVKILDHTSIYTHTTQHTIHTRIETRLYIHTYTSDSTNKKKQEQKTKWRASDSMRATLKRRNANGIPWMIILSISSTKLGKGLMGWCIKLRGKIGMDRESARERERVKRYWEAGACNCCFGF